MSMPQPTNFKITAQRILFGEVPEKPLNNINKFEIYSLAIHIRNGMANAIKYIFDIVNKSFSHRHSLVGENQFVEWWYTQIKNWNIEYCGETPEPLSFEELMARFSSRPITAEYHCIINNTKTHVKKTYKRHLNDYGNSPNEWDRLNAL